MKQTTIHHIPYPEDEDFAKGPINLEAIATKVDSLLKPTRDYYDSYNHLGFGAVSLSTNGGGFDAGFFGTILFDTIEFESGVLPGNVDNQISAIDDPGRNGWYTIGGYLPVTLSGTATANSFREMQIIVSPLPGTPGSPAVYHDRQYEDGTGSNQLAIETTAYLYYGCQVQMLFGHGNVAASSFMTPTAGARLWASQATWDVS